MLEEYMSRIVLSLPTILRSELFNQFLSISERIAAIRIKLNLSLSSSAVGGGDWTISGDTQPVVTPPNRPIQRIESTSLAVNGTMNPMLAGGGHRRVDSNNAESKSGRLNSFEYGDSVNDTLVCVCV